MPYSVHLARSRGNLDGWRDRGGVSDGQSTPLRAMETPIADHTLVMHVTQTARGLPRTIQFKGPSELLSMVTSTTHLSRALQKQHVRHHTTTPSHPIGHLIVTLCRPVSQPLPTSCSERPQFPGAVQLQPGEEQSRVDLPVWKLGTHKARV